jgi:hypothetical protein
MAPPVAPSPEAAPGDSVSDAALLVGVPEALDSEAGLGVSEALLGAEDVFEVPLGAEDVFDSAALLQTT